jgi:hypothetical protein
MNRDVVRERRDPAMLQAARAMRARIGPPRRLLRERIAMTDAVVTMQRARAVNVRAELRVQREVRAGHDLVPEQPNEREDQRR